jgi:hypothetical protein
MSMPLNKPSALMRRDFILSVAAAEEEERQRAELEAEQAAQRMRRTSVMAMRGPVPGVTPLPSHASFLAGLGREERRIVGKWGKLLGDAGGAEANRYLVACAPVQIL